MKSDQMHSPMAPAPGGRDGSAASLSDLENRPPPDQSAANEKTGVAHFRKLLNAAVRSNSAHRLEVIDLRGAVADRDSCLLNDQRAYQNALREKEKVIAELTEHGRELALKLQAIETSNFWRLFASARRFAEHLPPSQRKIMMKVARALWWIVTPHRLRERLEFYKISREHSQEETVSELTEALPSRVLLEPVTWFDTTFYTAQLTDADLVGVDALTHYVEIGWRQGRDPHPLFSNEWVLANILHSNATTKPKKSSGDIGGFIGVHETELQKKACDDINSEPESRLIPIFHQPPGRRPFEPTKEAQFLTMLEKAEVLSLDIFEAALIRRLSPKASVFQLVQERALLRDKPCASFAALRVRSEQVLREKQREKGESAPVTINLIYKELARILSLTVDDREWLLNLELEAETDVLSGNPRVYAWYKRAIAEGKKVVFVSDTSLPIKFLKKALRSAGYDKPRVFVAQNLRPDQSQTLLLHRIADQLNVTPAHILHLGAHHAADKKPKTGEGKDNQFLAGPNEPPFAEQMADSRHLRADRLEISMALGLSRWHRSKVGAQKLSFGHALAENVGYEIVGPTILGFASWVASRAQDDHLDRLLFLGRDGYLTHKVYEILRRGKPTLPRSRYVAASRRILFSRMFDSAEAIVDFSERRIGFSKTMSLAEHFDIFLLSPAEIMEAAKELGAEDLHAPLLGQLSQTGDPGEARLALNALARKLSPLILAKAREVERERQDYYRVAGELHDINKIGVVDLGWGGSMAEPLRRIIREILPDAQVSAYYFGLLPHATHVIPSDMVRQAYSFENFWPDVIMPYELPSILQPARVYGASLTLIEILLSENVPTAMRLTRNPETQEIEITRVADVTTREQRLFLERLQHSAFAFVENAIALLPKNMNDWDFRTLIALLWNRLLSSPTADEAAYLGAFPHRADPSGRTPNTHLIERPSPKPGAIAEAYYASLWPAGWCALLSPEERAQLLYEVEVQKP